MDAFFTAVAIADESIPPLKKIPNGTSEREQSLTVSVKSVLNCSIKSLSEISHLGA